MTSSIASTQSSLGISRQAAQNSHDALGDVRTLQPVAPAEVCGFTAYGNWAGRSKAAAVTVAHIASSRHYQDINISRIDHSKLSELMIDVHS